METSGPTTRVGAVEADGSATGRDTWMDALRGIALVLVVLTHVIALGTRLHGVHSGWLDTVSTTFAPVRIPTLMFLSGTLLARSLAKGPGAFVEGKARRILHPYLVWSGVYLVVWALLPRLDHPDGHDVALLDVLVEPFSVLWYLHHLFVYYLLALALRRVPTALVVAAAMAVALAVGTEHPDWRRFCFLLGVFLLGDLAARTGALTSPLLARPAVLVPAAVAACLLPVAAVAEWRIRYDPLWLPVAAAGLVVLVGVARATARTRVSPALEWLGRRSLPVYVAHWLLIPPALGLLVPVVGAERPVVLGLSAMAVTLAACALLAAAADRSPAVGLLFDLRRRDPRRLG